MSKWLSLRETLLYRSRLPEFPYSPCNVFAVRLQREVTGIEELDHRLRNIALERLGTIAHKTDPWQRMEMACIAHTVGLLDWRRAHQALFLMPPWHYPESIKGRVIALRDQYEKVFVDLIDDLPLRKGVDRRYLRLAMIGVLSWPIFWFKKDRDTPATIAKKMLSILRTGVEDAN
jgi:hypothetical protein